MDYEEACRRLKNHSGLPNSGPDDLSMHQSLWHLSRREPGPDLGPLFDDVIECLECINIALNGDIPSESASDRGHPKIDRLLCYSMTLIFAAQINFLQSSVDAEQRDEVFWMLRDLTLAWHCVLAGDIDGILQEIEWSR